MNTYYLYLLLYLLLISLSLYYLAFTRASEYNRLSYFYLFFFHIQPLMLGFISFFSRRLKIKKFIRAKISVLRDHLRFDDVFSIVFFGALGHIYKSTLLGTASKVADQPIYISYASRTPAENAFCQIHVTVHREDLIGVAACYQRSCRTSNMFPIT